MKKCLLLLLTFASLNANANDTASKKWKLDMPSGEVAKVVTKTHRQSTSYLLIVGNRPSLLLLKINSSQKINTIGKDGFIKIEDQNTANQRILFRLSFSSSASDSGQGQCGSGIEEYLFIVGVDRAQDVPSTLHRIPLESCWSDISLSDESDNVQVFQDPQRNESGIRIKYSLHPRWATPITLTYSLDNEFFNLETRSKKEQ